MSALGLATTSRTDSPTGRKGGFPARPSVALQIAGASPEKQMTSYSEKLKDPRWQKTRLEVLSRDGWNCRSCGSTEKTLHVHHSYYVGGRDPWDYPPSVLVSLCKDCHGTDLEGSLAGAIESLIESIVSRAPEGVDIEGLLLGLTVRFDMLVGCDGVQRRHLTEEEWKLLERSVSERITEIIGRG